MADTVNVLPDDEQRVPLTLHVHPHVAEILVALLKSGHFTNESDVVEEAVLHFHQRLEFFLQYVDRLEAAGISREELRELLDELDGTFHDQLH